MKHLKYVLAAVTLLFLVAILFVSCGKGGKLSSITISPSSAIIATGSTQQFQSFAHFTDGTMIEWTPESVWHSDDQNVTVGNVLGSFGLVSANDSSSGTVTITATDTANNLSSTATLSIIDPSSLVITPANPFMAIGTSHQFVASVILNLESGATVTQVITSRATWTTDDASIARITSPGGSLRTVATNTFSFPLISQITSTYTFTSGGVRSSVTGSTKLTVTATPLESITVSLPTSTLYRSGGLQQVQALATGIYSSGTISYDFTNSVTWKSSDSDIATITDSGLIMLVSTSTKTGTIKITAKDPITGKSGYAPFEVEN